MVNCGIGVRHLLHATEIITLRFERFGSKTPTQKMAVSEFADVRADLGALALYTQGRPRELGKRLGTLDPGIAL